MLNYVSLPEGNINKFSRVCCPLKDFVWKIVCNWMSCGLCHVWDHGPQHQRIPGYSSWICFWVVNDLFSVVDLWSNAFHQRYFMWLCLETCPRNPSINTWILCWNGVGPALSIFQYSGRALIFCCSLSWNSTSGCHCNPIKLKPLWNVAMYTNTFVLVPPATDAL